MDELRERVRSAVSRSRPVARTPRWFTSFRAIAAILLIAGAIVATIVVTSRGPVLASAAELSRIHRDNRSEGSHAIAVGSIQSARQVLTTQWSDCPQLPQVPGEVLESCHVHQFGGKRFACFALKLDGQHLSLAVAHAADMQLPAGAKSFTRGGINYYVQASGGVNIIIACRDGLWICVMGELPVERMVDFAASLRA